MFRFVESEPLFTANPPNPFSVLEGNNITFVWQYNLGGSFDDVVFRFIGTATLTIMDKHDLNRDAAVPKKVYQGRVQENINATRAEITIFALQRSESGFYEIELINSNRDRATNRVTVQVQCKLTTKSFMNGIPTSSICLKILKTFRQGESRFVVGYLISFILDVSCCYFPGSFGGYAVHNSARSLNCYNKNFLAPIFSKYAVGSRDLLQSYLETASRPTFLNYTYLI